MNRLSRLALRILLPCLLMLAVGRSGAQNADRIVGTFRVVSPFDRGDTAHVTVTRAPDDTYRGRISWVSKPNNPDGTPRTDLKNPNPKLRDRKATDVTMVYDLRFKSGEWVGGKLYDPYSGGTFGVQFKLADNGRDLEARYYKGRPLLGINAEWKRIK